MKSDRSASNRMRPGVVAVLGLIAIAVSAYSMFRASQQGTEPTTDFWLGSAHSGLVFGIATVLLWGIAQIWSPDGGQALPKIVAASAVTALASVTAVWVHPQGALGDLATWVTAGGTAVLALGVLLAWRSYQAQLTLAQEERDRREEEQARQVRLVRFHYRPWPNSDGITLWQTTIRNDSPDKVYDLRCSEFRTKREDGTFVAMKLVDRDVLKQFGILVGGWKFKDELEPYVEFEQWWMEDSPDAAVPDFSYRFTVLDAAGRYWSVIDHYEPKKIPRPSRKRPEQQDSSG
ncbi:hypothetical protein [Rhodococcus ruber]|uniref:hypothetical protein n=1 Tax=Rhodococcus ruber TaxID=1830 RepID=UPI001F35F974|nr:hypothetical protein [Rhodococcus ruber]MCF8786278.1 hypothetical protein [Rhodococcus ruber]